MPALRVRVLHRNIFYKPFYNWLIYYIWLYVNFRQPKEAFNILERLKLHFWSRLSSKSQGLPVDSFDRSGQSKRCSSTIVCGQYSVFLVVSVLSFFNFPKYYLLNTVDSDERGWWGMIRSSCSISSSKFSKVASTFKLLTSDIQLEVTTLADN